MPLTRSLLDKLSNALSPKIRKLKDINIKLLGTKTNVIRIKQDAINILGDADYSYQSDIVDNVIIQYPFNQIEIFGNKDQEDDGQDTNTIEFFDLLPINLYPYLEKGYISGASQIDENDIIVDVLWDDNGTGIPIIMQVSRQYGSFYGKYLISKKYEMNLRRGDIEEEIQDIIDTYISGQLLTNGVI